MNCAPLNSIILLSKMLSRNDKKNLDEKDVKQAKVIHQAGEELLRLINDILDPAKLRLENGYEYHEVRHILVAAELVQRSVPIWYEEKKLDFMIQDHLNATLKPIKTNSLKLSETCFPMPLNLQNKGRYRSQWNPILDRTQCFKSKYTIRGLAFRPTNTP